MKYVLFFILGHPEPSDIQELPELGFNFFFFSVLLQLGLLGISGLAGCQEQDHPLPLPSSTSLVSSSGSGMFFFSLFLSWRFLFSKHLFSDGRNFRVRFPHVHDAQIYRSSFAFGWARLLALQ